MGCDTAQGFLFAKPMAPDQLMKMLAARGGQDAPQASARDDARLESTHA
jgi:hypothetical protein